MKQQKRIAVFPGSFDPITKGHEAIVRKALSLFDEVVIAIGINSKKNYLFSTEQRLNWLETVFQDCTNVSFTTYNKLTVDFCKEVGAQFILRGLRNSTDFEFEKSIAQMNQAIQPEVQTVFLLTDAELAPISSTIAREIYSNKGDITSFIPEGIKIPPVQ